MSELNVHDLELCADPLKYATLRAEPDFQVCSLGSRAGRNGAVVLLGWRALRAVVLRAGP